MAWWGSYGKKDFTAFLRSVGQETFITSWELIKIIVPVVIVIKVLEETGLVRYLCYAIDPVMRIIGLPGELGLVWASSIVTSLYGGMAVFANLATGLHLTVGQVTVLCSVMLVAHSLPVELSISKKAGAPFWSIACLRIFGAVVYGFLLNKAFIFFDFLQEPAVFFFKPTSLDQTLVEWAINQAQNILFIVFVIFLILLVMRVLKRIGVIALLEKMLEPILPLFGMSKRAAPITVVGMLLGLGYGGALIIREALSGKLDRREVFFAMAFMSLCHGLIEDTLLMTSLGASLVGTLFGRVFFALLVIFILVKILYLSHVGRKVLVKKK